MNEISPPPDSDLVAAARGGDGAAFSALVLRHRPMVLALCRRLLGDVEAAEEAAQEAILQGLLRLNALRSPERFGPWLAGIGLNVGRRWLRQRARWTRATASVGAEPERLEPADAHPTPEDLAEQADLVARVRRAIAALPSGQQMAVRLYYLAGLTLAETAAQLGIAPNAVKARLFQARRSLRGPLAELWEGGT